MVPLQLRLARVLRPSRLAVPRRVYDYSHMEYIASIAGNIAKKPERVSGYRLTSAPKQLRHFNFTAQPL